MARPGGAADLLIVVVFTGVVLIIKQLGLGLAAVLLDAPSSG